MKKTLFLKCFLDSGDVFSKIFAEIQVIVMKLLCVRLIYISQLEFIVYT